MSAKEPQQQMMIDYNSLGYPSAEYIVYNLQTAVNYATLNGGAIKIPHSGGLKKLPLGSVVIHVHENHLDIRLISKEEYIAEKTLEKGLTADKGESK